MKVGKKKKGVFRISALVSLALAIGSGAALYSVSQEVHIAESELAGLEDRVEGERDSIRALRAEWDYLNNPERLEALAVKYLDMEAPAPSVMLSGAEEIPEPYSAGAEPEEATVPVVPYRLPVPPQAAAAASGDEGDFDALLKNLGRGGKR